MQEISEKVIQKLKETEKCLEDVFNGFCLTRFGNAFEDELVRMMKVFFDKDSEYFGMLKAIFNIYSNDVTNLEEINKQKFFQHFFRNGIKNYHLKSET